MRFGEWDAVLADPDATLPAGAPSFPYAVVIQHYARGLALLHSGHGNTTEPFKRTTRTNKGNPKGNTKGNIKAATLELAKLQKVAMDVSTDGGVYNMTRLASVANLTLSAAIARAQSIRVYKKRATIQTNDINNYTSGDNNDKYMSASSSSSSSSSSHSFVVDAIMMMKRAADMQNGWHYDEPPDWHAPVLQCLGKLLLDSGAAAQAEQVYLNDLRVYTENGWGLTGLLQAMEAQPNVHVPSDVAKVKARLDASWQHADVELPASSCAWFDF